MNPQRGIDAIALPSGKLIWRTASAAKPLLLFDDRLVAQAEAVTGMRALRVAVLNIVQSLRGMDGRPCGTGRAGLRDFSIKQIADGA